MALKRLKLMGVPFQILEECVRWLCPMAGDEIALVLSTPVEHERLSHL